MTDTQMQTLSQRVGAAHDMIQYILHSTSFESDGEIPGVLWGALNGVETLLQQAREYADNLPGEQPSGVQSVAASAR